MGGGRFKETGMEVWDGRVRESGSMGILERNI